MKKIIKLLPLLLFSCQNSSELPEVPTIDALLSSKSTTLIQVEDRQFRDLNGNGKLDVYEDQNQPIEARVDDLLSQMSPEEKAGMLFIDGVGVSEDAQPDGKLGLEGPGARRPPITQLMDEQKLTNFNVWTIPEDPQIFALWYNNVQLHAEQSRLGIPVTIASDPRHHFSEAIFSLAAKGFPQFCESLGLAAIGDEAFTKSFAEIVNREFLAIGIRMALFPQIDLATEPRWSRINGGFGEDAALTARMGRAYIEGLQGDSIDANSIACMTKHFPGGGPQKEGLDPHFEFQQGQIYPGDNFDYHLIPFEAAFDAGTAAIMPYYGIPMDQTDENVAMAFNKAIITGLLREKYNYDGIVCADWGVITDAPMGPNVVWPARAWGVEHLSEADRVLKVLEAGCDQFGGERRTELVLQLLEEGRLSEERVNISVRRILRLKFQLGLFDNPFVDETKVNEVIGTPEAIELGKQSQQRSLTLLKNQDGVLPLSLSEKKVYIENMDSAVVAEYAIVVNEPEAADLAIIRLQTPSTPIETNNPIALGLHHGDLDFKDEEKRRILDLLQRVPTVVDIYLDRPAVIPEIAESAVALIGNYGAGDQALCEVLFGNASPQGNLPFELPSSMEAVRSQLTDVPYDSEDPLFEFGFGLRYEE